MKAIPRVIAGTAVVLAAVLTTAPVTAGIADYVLNPGTQPSKRAVSQAPTGAGTVPLGTNGTRTSETALDEASGALSPAFDETEPSNTITSTAEVVADAAVGAEARVAELAVDLQAGVEAGEFSQVDADRVLDDLSGYIRGERTFPERSVV